MPRRQKDTRIYVLILWGFPDSVVWKHIKDLLRSIIEGEPKRADIPPTNTRPRMAFIAINGEEDARKAYNTLSGYVWNGSPLTAYLFQSQPTEQRLASPGNGLSEQVPSEQRSAANFPSGHGTSYAQPLGFIIGDAAQVGYGNSTVAPNPTQNPNRANIIGPMHDINQETVGHYPQQVPAVFRPAAPVPPREALSYQTACPPATPGHQRAPHWYQQRGQQEMQNLAFAYEMFQRYQMNAMDQSWTPVMICPLSPVPPFLPAEYGFTNPSAMPPAFGTPMYYPGIPNTESIPVASNSMHTNTNGTPINVAQGALPIESRGVFVHNLSHEATPKDVEDLFSQVGPVALCDVRKGADRGKRCNATVVFSSEGEAKAARDRFHDKPFMGRKISVRLDKETTLTQETPRTTGAGTSSGSTTSTGVVIANGFMRDLGEDPGEILIE